MVWPRSLWCAALSLTLVAACDKGSGGTSTSPKAGGGGVKAAAKGCDADWVDGLRAASVDSDAAGLETQADELKGACQAGCGEACIELGRRAAGGEEAKASFDDACAAGDELGCSLAEGPSAEAAPDLCAAGEWRGCAAGIAAAEPGSGDWETLERTATAACEANELRACVVAAWAACTGGRCDAAALDTAKRGGAIAGIGLHQGLAACHAGEAEQAGALLSAACDAGQSDACGRSCEQHHGHTLLVLDSARATSERVALLLELSGDAQPSWEPVVSSMDADTLAAFETMLDRFTPPITEVGAAAKVPKGLREQFPVLVEALLRAPNVDAKKIKYWFGRLPKMDDEQRGNLKVSLLKQSWMIPGDPSQTPRASIERQRLDALGLF